jgi:hypothetical protein
VFTKDVWLHTATPGWWNVWRILMIFWVCSCPNWSDMVVGIPGQVQYTKPPRPQDFLTDWSIKIRSIPKVSQISLTWWVLRGPPNRAQKKS